MPSQITFPDWAWWFMIKIAAAGIFCVGLIITAVFWKTGRLPYSGQTRKRDDRESILLEALKESTAASVAMRSMVQDLKSIAVSQVDRLDQVGRVLAAATQKLEDMHHDVRGTDARVGRIA